MVVLRLLVDDLLVLLFDLLADPEDHEATAKYLTHENCDEDDRVVTNSKNYFLLFLIFLRIVFLFIFQLCLGTFKALYLASASISLACVLVSNSRYLLDRHTANDDE